MRVARCLLFGLILLSLLQIIANADVDYPYVRLRLKVPPTTKPLCNPASLGKLENVQAEVNFNQSNLNVNYIRPQNFTESSGTFEGEAGGEAIGSYGYFFREPTAIPSLTTQEVTFNTQLNYDNTNSVTNFSAAQRVNDWLVVGFASQNPLDASLDIAGDFPFTAKAETNLYGKDFSGGMRFTADGKLEYDFTGGPATVTYTSEASAWSGFLSQEAVIPLTNLTEMRNNLNLSSPYVGTVAAKWRDILFGLNIMPIQASASFDNNIRSVVPTDTTDIYLYNPNFDPDNEADIADWTTSEARYGSRNGYNRNTISLPAGEIIATTKYSGFYQASTARFDLGTMYDVNDWLTVGFMLENVGGASLNFSGSGISTYINHRDINTSEADSLSDILLPGNQIDCNLVTDTWTTTNEVNSTKLFLEAGKNYSLPKRLKLSLSLKQPFLIALDYEQNQTPVIFTSYENNRSRLITINNLSLIHLALESQLFVLPLWLKGGTTFALKPDINGLSIQQQQTFDTLFQFGLLPTKLDLGLYTKAWGTTIGTSIGVSAQSILSLAQFDTTSSDLTKLGQFSLYALREQWQVTYLAQFDPAGTYYIYSSKTVAAGEKKSFATSDLRFMQTLGVTYRF